MAFEDEFKKIGESVLLYEASGDLKTEEATKMALISPFINNVLGYNVFDPKEVVPETNADLSGKAGEKVDYSIVINEKPLILIEAKHIDNPLSKREVDLVLQL